MKKPVPKKSAVKKASAKKIKAPKAFKPAGKPKEYLAYLNKREMELLKKFNGGTIKLGPRGLPSFADDSASSQGVSRGDTSQGTKGSGSSPGANGGSVSNKSTSSAGNRGPTGPSGEARSSPAGNAGGSPGSTSRNSGNAGAGQGGQNDKGFGGVPGTASRSGGSLAQKGQTSPMGGQGSSFKTPAAASSYNKTVAKPSSPMGGQGTSFSTPQKAAAYNRGVAPKTPQSPMSNQGTSFKTPQAAKKANEQYIDRYGFYNKAVSRFPSAIDDIKDDRYRMGPFKGDLPDGYMMDVYKEKFNPNDPRTWQDRQKMVEYSNAKRQLEARDYVESYRDDYTTPQEIAEAARRYEDSVFAPIGKALSAQYSAERGGVPGESALSEITRRQASRDTPNVGLPSRPGARAQGGSGEGFGGGAGRGYRNGGLVRRTFKNK